MPLNLVSRRFPRTQPICHHPATRFPQEASKVVEWVIRWVAQPGGIVVLRVKGFVRREDGTFVEVQVTPAQASVEPARWQGRPGLVFVGLGLDRSSLERYFALDAP